MGNEGSEPFIQRFPKCFIQRILRESLYVLSKQMKLGKSVSF